MADITLKSLCALYDEITANVKPMPMAAILPVHKRFNDVANMIVEQIHIPVYRSAWIGPPMPRLRKRSAYKNRAGRRTVYLFARSGFAQTQDEPISDVTRQDLSVIQIRLTIRCEAR